MNKKFIPVVMLAVFLLSAATAYSAPSLNHMFYDDASEGLYVYGSLDDDKDVADVGIYLNGVKYGLVNDEIGTENLDTFNDYENPKKFGIGLIASKSHFQYISFIPYSLYEDGTEVLGAPKTYNGDDNSIYRENVLFFENFQDYNEGELPDSLKVTPGKGTSAKIVSHQTEEGITKNMLFLNDTAEDNIVTTLLTLPEYKDDLLLEIKFKIHKTTTAGFGFIMDFKGNGNNAFRVIKYADTSTQGITYVSGSSYGVSGGTDISYDGEWFAMKLRIDTRRHINQMIFENSGYGTTDINLSNLPYGWQNKEGKFLLNYNLLWYDEFEDELDTINWSTYKKSCGEYYIDYIKISENTEEFEPKRTRAPSKDIERIPDPVLNW